jgi:hypothetical protein
VKALIGNKEMIKLDEKKDKFKFILITLTSKEGDLEPEFKLVGEVVNG